MTSQKTTLLSFDIKRLGFSMVVSLHGVPPVVGN
jgi:hypothetical protein